MPDLTKRFLCVFVMVLAIVSLGSVLVEGCVDCVYVPFNGTKCTAVSGSGHNNCSNSPCRAWDSCSTNGGPEDQLQPQHPDLP